MGSRFRWASILALAFILALAGWFVVLRWQKWNMDPHDTKADVLYLACGHTGAKRVVDRALRARLARSKIGDSIDGWRLIARSGRKLSILYEDPLACPACRKARFLGVASSGFIAIFSGTPTNPGSPLEMTHLRADDLPEPELIDLRRGIPFVTEKERLQLLEGLTALLHE